MGDGRCNLERFANVCLLQTWVKEGSDFVMFAFLDEAGKLFMHGLLWCDVREQYVHGNIGTAQHEVVHLA